MFELQISTLAVVIGMIPSNDRSGFSIPDKALMMSTKFNSWNKIEITFFKKLRRNNNKKRNITIFPGLH